MPEDFEPNPFSISAEGIHSAGNQAISLMKWMVRDKYYENINHYDFVAIVLTFMKGENYTYQKKFFHL